MAVEQQHRHNKTQTQQTLYIICQVFSSNTSNWSCGASLQERVRCGCRDISHAPSSSRHSALRRPLIWRTRALPLFQCHTTPQLIATFKLTSVKSLEIYSQSDYSDWVCFILYSSFQWHSKCLLMRLVCAELRMQLQHVSLPPCMIKHDIMKWPWLSLPE